MDTLNLPKDIAFRIELPSFEGPLDLLLHLIKKHELDVLDLPIAFVTERYLHYLQMMQELDLDVASEYLLMAATLAHIKSKSLLPPSPKEDEEESDDEYVEDPRAELIRRLLEYQKYKQAAAQLDERPMPGRDVFTRGTPAPKAQGQAPLAEISLFKLLDAFEGILKRVRGKVAFEVTAERISIQERMTQITELLRIRKVCDFEELFESDRTRYDVVVTFLALLEMTKLHVTRLAQANVDAPIRVMYALLENGEAEPLKAKQPQVATQAQPAADESPKDTPAEIAPEEAVQQSPWSTLDPDLEALEEEFGQDFDVNEWLLQEGDEEEEEADGDQLFADEQAWTSLSTDEPDEQGALGEEVADPTDDGGEASALVDDGEETIDLDAAMSAYEFDDELVEDEQLGSAPPPSAANPDGLGDKDDTLTSEAAAGPTPVAAGTDVPAGDDAATVDESAAAVAEDTPPGDDPTSVAATDSAEDAPERSDA